MNRYLAAFVAHYSTLREPITATFDYDDWEQRFRASNIEYQAAFNALLDRAYPLARVAMNFGSTSTQVGSN